MKSVKTINHLYKDNKYDELLQSPVPKTLPQEDLIDEDHVQPSSLIPEVVVYGQCNVDGEEIRRPHQELLI